MRSTVRHCNTVSVLVASNESCEGAFSICTVCGGDRSAGVDVASKRDWSARVCAEMMEGRHAGCKRNNSSSTACEGTRSMRLCARLTKGEHTDYRELDFMQA